MHYYKFNVGNYYRRTNNLSLLEDLAYRRMLDNYYLDEKPLPDDIAKIARSIGMRESLNEVSIILEDYFYLQDGNWHNEAADKQIKAYKANSETNKNNGKKGGRPRKKTQSVADGNPMETETKGNQEPITNNQEPVTKEKIPYQLIADAYNEFFYSKVNNSSKCQTVSPKRKKAISKLWNHKPYQPTGKVSTNNIGYWQRYFEYSSNQAGLNGGKASKDFDWIADFDALMNFNKYVKNIEGGYA